MTVNPCGDSTISNVVAELCGVGIGGKTSEITKEDLLDFAKQNDVKNANAIISRVADTIKDFNRYANEYGVTQP